MIRSVPRDWEAVSLVTEPDIPNVRYGWIADIDVDMKADRPFGGCPAYAEAQRAGSS